MDERDHKAMNEELNQGGTKMEDFKKQMEEAKKYLSKEGYGTGTNFTLNSVANLMVEWRIKNLVIPDVSGRSEQLSDLDGETILVKFKVSKMKPKINID